MGNTPKAQVLVRGETAYNIDLGVSKKVCRPNKVASDVNPEPHSLGVPIKPAKKNDVKRLLNLHFGEEWETILYLRFYTNLINEENAIDIVSEDENDGGLMEDIDDII